MSRTVRVELTEAQARCVLSALGVLAAEKEADEQAHPETWGLLDRTRLKVAKALHPMVTVSGDAEPQERPR